MTKTHTAKKYTCCIDGRFDDDARAYHAASPEHAAEYYAEDVWDTILDGLIGEVQINVLDEDGNEYEVPVEIQPSKPTALAKRKN